MPSTLRKPVGRQLRHVITLQAPVRSRATDGQSKPTWSDKGEVRARIQPLSGREYWLADQVQAEVTHRVTLRAYPGLTADWRVLFQGRIFNVISVRSADEEMGRWVEAMCREVT